MEEDEERSRNLVNEGLSDVPDVPRGSAGGQHHVVCPVEVLSRRYDPHVTGLHVTEHLLHLLKVQQTHVAGAFSRGGEVAEEPRKP